MRLLELANLLDMVHKVSSIYILHHEVQSVLECKVEDVRKEKKGSKMNQSVASTVTSYKSGVCGQIQMIQT